MMKKNVWQSYIFLLKGGKKRFFFSLKLIKSRNNHTWAYFQVTPPFNYYKVSIGFLWIIITKFEELATHPSWHTCHKWDMLRQTDDLQLEFYKLMLQIFISYQKSLAIVLYLWARYRPDTIDSGKVKQFNIKIFTRKSLVF